MRFLLLTCWLGCLALSPAMAVPSLRVVATVGMVADLVREVAGDEADVTALIGEGVDPHVYKPTRHDVLQLNRADMVFYNGLLLEGRMETVLEKLAARKPVVAVAGRLTGNRLLDDPVKQGHHDPHVWMDVDLWSHGIDLVADALVRQRPEREPYFRANAARFRSELQELDAYVREIMASIPDSRRVLVTAHDAFSYFGRAYGIEVRGIQGISTESEAGLNDINRLVDMIVERDIRAIFVETSVADRNIKALIEGAKARGHEVIVGGSLYSDAMGPSGTYEGTYVGMMDHNAGTMVAALGGSVPEGGFQAWRKAREP